MPQYRSKFKAFRVNIRPEIKEYHPNMPVVVRTIPEMVAEFAVHRPEVEVETDAGMERYGDISGHFYDLDADAEAKGWTDEEYQIAQARLDSLCETWPEAIQRLEPVAPTAPWATYDSIDGNRIAILADELGLVAEALTYETATLNRKQVVAALKKLIEESKVEEELTAA